MKRFLTLLLALTFVFSFTLALASCGIITPSTDEVETITVGAKSFTYPKGYIVTANTDNYTMIMEASGNSLITITAVSDQLYEGETFSYTPPYATPEIFKVAYASSNIGETITGDVEFEIGQNSQKITFVSTDDLDGEVTYRVVYIEAIVSNQNVVTQYLVEVIEKSPERPAASALFS